jgi:hypothetical protein
MKTRILVVLITIFCSAESCLGQSAATSLSDWLNQRVQAALDAAKVHENGKGASRQKETLSTDDRSTSLVDQSSATDFLSTALQLIPLSNINGLAPGQQTGSTADASKQGSGSGSVTATGYSLVAALSRHSLTDPQFYKDHTNARRVSFTVGTAASDPATDGTSKVGTILGAKVTVINGRDLYSVTGRTAVDEVQHANSARTQAANALFDQIQRLVFEACQPAGDCTLGRGAIDPSQYPGAFFTFWARFKNMNDLRLSPDLLQEIDLEIRASLPKYENYQKLVKDVYDKVRNARQLALSYQVVRRPDAGNDDHRAEASFDYGLTDRITWTLNGSFDYKDRKQLTAIRGGRFATEFKGNLTPENLNPLGGSPVTLSFSGEAKWMEQLKPQYTFQAKITIPLGTGIDLPIAYRLANRQAQISQHDSEARFGLTIDVARLIQSLK